MVNIYVICILVFVFWFESGSYIFCIYVVLFLCNIFILGCILKKIWSLDSELLFIKEDFFKLMVKFKFSYFYLKLKLMVRNK